MILQKFNTPSRYDKAKLIKESTSRKHKIREVEADRDRLAGVVESYQRREVEQLAAEHLADVLDDDGNVDPGAVREAAERVVADKPHWSNRRTPKPDPSQGARQVDTPTPQRLGAIFTQQPPRR